MQENLVAEWPNILKVIALGFFTIAVVALYVASLHNFQIGTYEDEAYYIVSAQSLAAGKGYVLGRIIGSPPMLRLPPGYPLLLALVTRVIPHSLMVFRLPSLVLTLASFPLWLKILSKRLSFGWAILTMSAVAVNQLIVESATTAMSEAPTLFLVAVLILLMDYVLHRRDEISWRRSAGVTMAVIAVLVALHFTRSIMIVFVAAVFIALVLNRQVRRAFIIAVLAVLPFMGWMGYSTGILPSTGIVTILSGGSRTTTDPADGRMKMASTYGTDVISVNDKQITATPGGLLLAILKRPWAWGAIYIPGSLGLDLVPYGSPRLITRTLLAFHVDWLPAVVSSLPTWIILVGLISSFAIRRRTQDGFAELAVLLYMASLLLWPYPSGRFFEPVEPLIYGSLVLGVAAIMQRFPIAIRGPALTRTAIAAVLAVAFLVNFRNDIDRVPHPMHTIVPDVSAGSTWLSIHTSPDAVVLSDDPVVHSLYVHRPLSTLPGTALTGGAYLVSLRQNHASYILVTPSLSGTRVDPQYSPSMQAMQKIIASYPDQFRLVYSSQPDHAEIYQFLGR